MCIKDKYQKTGFAGLLGVARCCSRLLGVAQGGGPGVFCFKAIRMLKGIKKALFSNTAQRASSTVADSLQGLQGCRIQCLVMLRLGFALAASTLMWKALHMHSTVSAPQRLSVSGGSACLCQRRAFEKWEHSQGSR